MYAFRTIALTAVTLSLSATTVAADIDKKHVEETIVTVTDENLREVILKVKNQYGQQGAQITQADLQTIHFIEARGKAIRVLTGLEHCHHLSEARLANHSIVDVAPLSLCRSLQSLDFSQN